MQSVFVKYFFSWTIDCQVILSLLNSIWTDGLTVGIFFQNLYVIQHGYNVCLVVLSKWCSQHLISNAHYWRCSRQKQLFNVSGLIVLFASMNFKKNHIADNGHKMKTTSDLNCSGEIDARRKPNIFHSFVQFLRLWEQWVFFCLCIMSCPRITIDLQSTEVRFPRGNYSFGGQIL